MEDSGNTSWFIEAGDRLHRSDEVFYYVNEYFNNYLIVKNYFKHTRNCMDWAPYLSDITTYDFSLCRIPEYRGVLTPVSKNTAKLNSTFLLHGRPLQM